jgi:hypothetical protein
LTGPSCFTADAPKLLANVDSSRVKVDIGAAQAGDFAPAQAVQDQEHERRMQWVGLGGCQELRAGSSPSADMA